MNFDDLYQVLELVESDNERETYAAREIATGRQVFIHVLSKNSDQVPPLLDIAKRHAASQSDASVLELKVGTFQNEDCLVTKAAPELQNIRHAMEQGNASGPFDKARIWKVPAAVETNPDAAPITSQDGDFTRMFFQEQSKPAPPQGEFTRMFQTPEEKPSPAQESIAPTISAAAVPSPKHSSEPAQPPSGPPPGQGAFTQIFSAPPAQTQPGESTRMLKSEASDPPVLEPTRPPATVSREPEPGEFTRMFKSDPEPAPASKENWLDYVEKPKTGDSLDPINWDSPQSQGATGAFAAPTPLPAQPPVQEGPSEFTRFISVPSKLPEQSESSPASSEAPQPAQPQPPQKATLNLPIIIGLNVILMTVIALILYFVLKR